jgi:hypothetical protein
MFRKLLCFSSLTILAALMICTAGTTSCTKTNTVIDTVTNTVTKTDTINVPEKDTIVTPAILTANSWKATYDRASIGGNIVFYIRGASGNTMDLDNEYITFNANSAGVYTDNSGNQTTFTWSYSDSTYTKLVWIWNLSPQAVTVSWENLSYHDGAIHYTEYYDDNGTEVLSSVIRAPK